jgi:hypothetical protein
VAILPSISLTLVENVLPVLTTPAVLVAKFAASAIDTGGKFEMTTMLFSGAWGKMIHEKNLKQKIS